MFSQNTHISENFSQDDKIVIHPGDCIGLLKKIPDDFLSLIVTSPPYNIGKEYEKRLHINPGLWPNSLF